MISILDDKGEEGWSGVVSSVNVSIPTYWLISFFLDHRQVE